MKIDEELKIQENDVEELKTVGGGIFQHLWDVSFTAKEFQGNDSQFVQLSILYYST